MTKKDISEELEYIEKVSKINAGKNLKYNILTMGCQLNENDSEKICGMVEKMGYAKTDDISSADLVIYNTCCVRENAEEKLFGKLGEVKKLKEAKGTIIAIGGCMMQEKHIVDKIKKSYKYDVIFGTHTLHKFPKDLYNAIMESKKVTDILDIDGEIIEGLPIKREDNIRASVTIMNGCNNFCTYCIVPYVRGRERSRSPEDILKEVESLAKAGYKEITLLGQNVNSYMRVEREKGLAESKIDSFAKLLREVSKIDGIEKIRFTSPHPKDFTDDVIDAIKDLDKVSKLVHLPLQSGSTSVLKAMNRVYTKEQYLNLVQKMKDKIPGVKFSTDIIVGFPGETEEDFEDTLDVVRKVKFEQIFMFIYSRRVGTPADKMENQIPEEIKHKRFDRLKALYEAQLVENNKEYINTVQNLLVEGYSKTNSEFLTGRTDTNKVVIFEGDSSLIGKFVPVKIVSEHMWYLKGEIL
jgi:tRNA-2-methylthio-N6-dimethylallyladenosine synthase